MIILKLVTSLEKKGSQISNSLAPIAFDNR